LFACGRDGYRINILAWYSKGSGFDRSECKVKKIKGDVIRTKCVARKEDMENLYKIFGENMGGKLGGLNKHARNVLRKMSRSVNMRVYSVNVSYDVMQ
jgi:Flp pilus assembly secretin CpaC